MGIKAKLKAIKPKPVKIKVEAWEGEEVFIMPLSKRERKEHSEFLERSKDPEDKEVSAAGVMDAYIFDHLVDEEGEPLFDPQSEEDLEIMGELPDEGFYFVYACITQPMVRKSAEIEEAKKNSKRTKR